MKTYNITKIKIIGLVSLLTFTQICSAAWNPRRAALNNTQTVRNVGAITMKEGGGRIHVGTGNVTNHRKTVFASARNVYSKVRRAHVAARNVRFHALYNRKNRPNVNLGRAVRGYFRFAGYAQNANNSRRFAYSGAVLYGYANYRNGFSGWRYNDGRTLRSSTSVKSLTGYPQGYTRNYFLHFYVNSTRRGVRSFRDHHKFYNTRVGDGIIGAPFWIPSSDGRFWRVGGIVTSKDTTGSSINVGVMALSQAYITMARKAARR